MLHRLGAILGCVVGGIAIACGGASSPGVEEATSTVSNDGSAPTATVAQGSSGSAAAPAMSMPGAMSSAGTGAPSEAGSANTGGAAASTGGAAATSSSTPAAGNAAPPSSDSGTGEETAGDSAQSAGSGGGSAPTTPPEVVCPPESTLRPGDQTLRTPVGGRDGGMRTYIVHVPQSYDGTKPVPLMINFHPLIFGTGMGQRTGSGWAQVGDDEGMITAFPDGYDAAWDIGNCCTRGDVDDLAFAKAMVEEISKGACIDPNRIYASGYSMGGGFSHLLGCKAADIFAAVAPSAFDLTEENHVPCEPARPITVFMHRGMGDTVVPYAGGPTTPPNGTPVTVTMFGAIGSFEAWAKMNNCTDQPTTEGNCQRHSQCDNGVEVVLCENGSHTEGPAPKIWETLKKHGLAGPL